MQRFLLMLLFIFPALLGNAQTINVIPELSFTDAKLVAGVSNQDGAVYLFSNVAPGVDATVTILGRSAPDVVLDTIDIPSVNGMGFTKSLQPQMGIKGVTPANSKWWMKFKLDFFEAGKTKPLTIGKFTATALDIDGDNVSIAENVTMENATSASLAFNTSLTQGLVLPSLCPKDGKPSLSIRCVTCEGTGYITKNNGEVKSCSDCKGIGYLFALCEHPFTNADFFAQGTIVNAPGIDTTAYQSMETFTYDNTSSLTFTYGAVSGAATSTAGERLNSLWFKSFNMENIMGLLPLKLVEFNAAIQQSEVKLNWIAEQLKDFNHFRVQRSTDGRNFDDIAVIFPADKKTTEATYNYDDDISKSPFNVLYYRLKMVDNSGKITYSSIRVLTQHQHNNGMSIVAYPNPATDQLLVNLPAAWQGSKMMAQVTNINGAVVKTVQFSNVNQTERIGVQQLAPGMYTVSVVCQNQTLQAKIMKQ